MTSNKNILPIMVLYQLFNHFNYSLGKTQHVLTCFKIVLSSVRLN